MTKLFLVRHGDTELHSSRLFVGHCDAELNAFGLKQVERLRDRLATEKIDAIYASDLKRALVTAETIASRHQLEVITCSELREISYGEIEGLTFDKISQLYPEVAELCTTWSLQLKFPGGESFGELEGRVSKFLDRLKQHAPEQTILIVAHGGPIRLMVCLLLGVALVHWRQFYIDLASLSIIDTYPQVAILNLLNDISHLR
ncbi:histidine phosphatase family protein [Chloroflexota bacterium]